MGNCGECGGEKDKKEKVTDDVTGIRRPIDDPDTARLNRTADLEEEDVIRTVEADPRIKPKKV